MFPQELSSKSGLLGCQVTEDLDMVYKTIGSINDHNFEVIPVTRREYKKSAAKFISLVGSLNPFFDAEKFDILRNRLQLLNKKEKDSYLIAIGILYVEYLSRSFTKEPKAIYSEIEKSFFPAYLPTYSQALISFGLSEFKPLWWRPISFCSLENISRLPLDDCNADRQTTLSFEDWYCLFFNYYSPFNALAFSLFITSRSILYTTELIESIAQHLQWRHSLIDDPDAKKAPILFFGPVIGNFGNFLNQTGKIPVPIIHCHSNPRENPYLLIIPPHKQSEFKVPPILKMGMEEALEKYKPSIVLLAEMPMHKDLTAMIRQTGSIREYYYFGLPDSYIEGNAWDTWGNIRYRPSTSPNPSYFLRNIFSIQKSNMYPPFVRDGWVRMQLNHISRWMIYKFDSDMGIGTGSVSWWFRRPLMPSFKEIWKLKLKRLTPFF